MRWLSFLVLVGCGGVVPVCSDAPLAPQTCTAIGGTWVLLQAGQQVRCGAQVFEQGLTLESSGGLLTGAMAGRELSGFHYPDGVFEAYGSFETEERFSFRGQHHAVRGRARGAARGGEVQPDERRLRHGMAVRGPPPVTTLSYL